MELYKHKRSKFFTADFTLNGRRYRKSTKQTTRGKALEVAGELLRQAQSGQAPDLKGQVPTLREFVKNQFLPLNAASGKIKPKTKEYYVEGWHQLENQSIASMRLDQIRTPHIDAVQVDGSPSAHNRALRTLRRILHIAFVLDLIMKVPDSLS